ncbi:MAG: DUF1583 domain-containing protein [Gemmataceae bacterium]|nr:DUF1583 domain-containing protein [Gemmataceae bacterium]
MNALLAGAVLTLGQAGAPGQVEIKAEEVEVHQDLRDQRPIHPSLRMTGPFVSKYTIREPEGLRVTLPAKREKYAPIALQTNFRIPGDFEITATYELFSADAPDSPDKPAAVVGVNIYVVQGDGDRRTARIGRFNTRRGHVYEIQHTDRTRERPTKMQRFPTQEWAGQFRLVRKGAALHYLVKDAGTGDEFRELFVAEHFGDGDVTVVRCAVNTTEQPCAVDARLIDFRVRSVNLPAAVADPTPREERRGYWWLATAVAIAAVLAGGAAIAGLRRRRRMRRTAGDRAMSEASEQPAAPNHGTVHVPCPACGKRLKVSSTNLGKKVKCPGCDTAFVAATE